MRHFFANIPMNYNEDLEMHEWCLEYITVNFEQYIYTQYMYTNYGTANEAVEYAHQMFQENNQIIRINFWCDLSWWGEIYA